MLINQGIQKTAVFTWVDREKVENIKRQNGKNMLIYRAQI